MVSNYAIKLYLHAHRLVQLSDSLFVQKVVVGKKLKIHPRENKDHKWDTSTIALPPRFTGHQGRRIELGKNQSDDFLERTGSLHL